MAISTRLARRQTVFLLSLSLFSALCAAPNVHADGNTASLSRALPQNDVPQAVTSGQARALGALDGKRHLKLALHLPLRNEAELNDLVRQLYDSKSPNYHQYLSADEFTQRFGPTQADYEAVVNWASAQGLTVTNTTRNRHLIDVEGSVDDINRVLHVNMTTYQHPTELRQFFAPDRQPSTDSPIALAEVSGLDNFAPPRSSLKQGTPAQIADAVAVAHAGGSGAGGIFLPSDMRAAYYGSGPLTGAGQSVGIFSFDGYLASDVTLFYTRTGMSSTVPINNVLVNGYSGVCSDPVNGSSTCDDGEQILDIVNVIGMAPGITQVLFYEGDSGPDILNQMATDNIAKVLSSSWGSGDMAGTFVDPIFLEFQAQGQTFLNATGDDGAYNAQTWSPPSLNPLILEVGATHLTTSTPGGPWSDETGWPDAGGGFYAPAGYSIPSYQQATGTVNSPVINMTNAGSTTLRNDPDVAAEGDFDNPTVSNGRFQTGFGGTSFAAPRWAGFIALANEQSVANGTGTLGFVNPAIYNVGVSADYTTSFHDVIFGSNPPSTGAGTGFSAATGYDLITGWGSPNGANLISLLSGSTTTPGFVLGAYPIVLNMIAGSSISTTITVSSLNGFSGNVDLTATGLPSGVTATFSPASTNSTSTLTLTADTGAAIGPVTILISDAADTMLLDTTSVKLLVGNPPTAAVDSSLAFDAVVPMGDRDEALTIANAVNSVPLTYSAATFASTDGTCTGSVSWLTIAANHGTLTSGQSVGVDVTVTPGSASLAPGTYAAEVCVSTNDPTQPVIAVPVSLAVVAGPAKETIFLSGFESGEAAGNGANVVTFTINMPVENDQAGSALDLATGNYHTWNATTVDNVNLYNDSGAGLAVYWYDDAVPASFKNKVGGVLVSGQYAILQSGATVGPTSTFSRTTSMTNWWPGIDGFIGISFYNSQTHTRNYGYIHLQTSAVAGFPASVLEYAYDSAGAAIRVP